MLSDPAADQPPLRMGVMCSGTTFEAWQARCIEDLLALGFVKPTVLIADASEAPPRPRGLGKLKAAITSRRTAWNLYHRLFVRSASRASRPVDLSESLTGVPVLRCRPERRGRFACELAPSDIETLRDHRLDFILRFAFGIIKGEVLTLPRYGVWSFHHDDLDVYRGPPACFWPLYENDPIQGVTLQRLTEGIDNGIVLHTGHFNAVRHSYVRNRDAAFMGAAHFPAKVCRDIRAGNHSRVLSAPSPTRAPVRTVPGNGQTLVFAMKMAKRKAGNVLASLFRHTQWNVGMVDAPIAAFLKSPTPARTDWLPVGRRGSFVADPFGIERAGRTVVLAETFDDREGVGRIGALDWSGPARSPSTVLSRPFHLSYPFLLEHEDEIYCIPEMYENRRVELHRALEFPTRWELAATLVSDVAAIDPTLVRWDGRWWLFAATKDRYTEIRLMAWHAPDLRGPFTPHACNPLKCDVRSSRPAGTPFVHEGRLYRPAQDCSRSYGGAVAINRVVTLTPTAFEETVETVVRADPRSPFPDGLHTISAVGPRTLIDGKRTVFLPREFLAQLRRMLRIPTSAAASAGATLPSGSPAGARS